MAAVPRPGSLLSTYYLEWEAPPCWPGRPGCTCPTQAAQPFISLAWQGNISAAPKKFETPLTTTGEHVSCAKITFSERESNWDPFVRPHFESTILFGLQSDSSRTSSFQKPSFSCIEECIVDSLVR